MTDKPGINWGCVTVLTVMIVLYIVGALAIWWIAQ